MVAHDLDAELSTIGIWIGLVSLVLTALVLPVAWLLDRRPRAEPPTPVKPKRKRKKRRRKTRR